MTEWLAERFEENRAHLRRVAYRMLGSLAEADDAVQETWLRLSRSDAAGIENLGGWLTTVVARVCLDMLRSRSSRREDSLDANPPALAPSAASLDPEQEALLSDSVGLALLVVLDRLTPPERLAFVLHDMFAMPFEEIAEIVQRSPEATRQLASRARRRIQGAPVPGAELARQREIVEAFLAAVRAGDFEKLVSLLDPDFVVHADQVASATGAAREIHGADEWARVALSFSRGARFTRPMLVNDAVGAVLAPHGRLTRVLTFTIAAGKITRMEIVGEPARLREFNLALLPD